MRSKPVPGWTHVCVIRGGYAGMSQNSTWPASGQLRVGRRWQSAGRAAAGSFPTSEFLRGGRQGQHVRCSSHWGRAQRQIAAGTLVMITCNAILLDRAKGCVHRARPEYIWCNQCTRPRECRRTIFGRFFFAVFASQRRRFHIQQIGQRREWCAFAAGGPLVDRSPLAMLRRKGLATGGPHWPHWVLRAERIESGRTNRIASPEGMGRVTQDAPNDQRRPSRTRME